MDVLVIVDLEADGLTLHRLLDGADLAVEVQLSHELRPIDTGTVVVDLFTHPDGGTYLLADLVAEGRRVLAVVDDEDAWNARRSREVGAEIVVRADLEQLPARLVASSPTAAPGQAPVGDTVASREASVLRSA